MLHYMSEIMDYSERRLSAAIRQLPRGSFSSQDFLEGDGLSTEKIAIRVTVTVQESELVADFRESDPQALGPINCRPPSVKACAYYLAKALLDPGLPPNSGAFRPIRVLTKPGTLMEVQFPGALCNANIVTTQRIVDALMGAFLQIIPERAAAACSGTMNLLNIGGIDPRNGVYYNYVETYAGGQGAMQKQDGMDAVQNHMTNTRNAPIESIEQSYPLLVESYGLVADTEGAGEHRGGVGLRRSFRVLGDQIRVTLSSDRARNAPWGLFGGQSATSSRCVVVGPDGPVRTLPSKVTTDIEHGLVLETTTPGGGGWGDPRKRDADAVLRDVIEGVVSPARARDVYGVAVNTENMTIDEAKTAKLRNGA
jgi:N-methylhydantoinase B